MNIRAKILEEPTVIDARYGKCIITKVRILQNGEDVAIFSKLGDPVAASKTKGQHVLIAKNAKGKYVILDDTMSNGNSNIQMNRPSSQEEGSYYTHSNSNSLNATPVHNYVPHVDDDILDLPTPLSDQDKVRLKKLIVERTKLLNACIQAVRREMPDVKDERSLRSLAVTIFININPYLPK